jgi:DNA invertase Pin-like site-specific DNA recombinase
VPVQKREPEEDYSEIGKRAVKGVTLVVQTTTMPAVPAEFERDQVSERTRFALAHKKAKGERTGGVPYGFRLAEDVACTRPSRSSSGP